MIDDRVAIISFYSFIKIVEPSDLLVKLMALGKRKSLRGTILLATEGFNGSISGGINEVQLLLDEIIKLTGAKDVNVKINYAQDHPFRRLKIKVKKEIITLGVDELNVEKLKGEYIETKDWDAFIARDDVVLIDTRNHYESAKGTFRGAILPNTETFKEFPNWVEANRHLLENKKIAMECTGGIRCEKSTAYLKSLGYMQVYHLRGGILQYLEDTGNTNKLWQGECFVFDDRRAVSKDLSPAQGHWLVRDN